MQELYTVWLTNPNYYDSFLVQQAFYLMRKYCAHKKNVMNVSFYDYIINIISKLNDTNEIIAFLLFQVFENSNLKIEDLSIFDFSKESLDLVNYLNLVKKESYWNMIELCYKNTHARKIKEAELSYKQELYQNNNLLETIDCKQNMQALFYLSGVIDYIEE